MPTNHESQVLRGILTMLLLQLLADGEDYGYAVVVRLQVLGFDDLSEGTVYPALTRLEKQGLLESRLVPSDAGPARKYYRPTPAGLTHLDEVTDSWHDLRVNVDRVLRATTTGSATADPTPMGGPS